MERKTFIIGLMFCFAWLALTTQSSHAERPHLLHDIEAISHDVHAVEHTGHELSKVDHETHSLWSDAERVDGLLPSIHHESDSHPLEDAERDLRDAEKADNVYNDAQRAECDRLHAEYTLRHPPGTKPQGLKGKHGCSLYKQDAHYHDEHPDMVSVLGANMYVGIEGAHVGF